MAEHELPMKDSTVSSDNGGVVSEDKWAEKKHESVEETPQDEVTKDEVQPAPQTLPGPPVVTYPDTVPAILLTIALLLAMFLVALDMVSLTIHFLCGREALSTTNDDKHRASSQQPFQQ